MIEWKTDTWQVTSCWFGCVPCQIEYMSARQGYVITLSDRQLKRVWPALPEAKRYAVVVAADWLPRAAREAVDALAQYAEAEIGAES
ncbi:MAG: hypothetical protein ABIK12_06430 [Pseudomonadota bacterium]